MPQGVSGAIIGEHGGDAGNGQGDGDGDSDASGGGSGGRRWLLGGDDVISVASSTETYWGMAGYFHDNSIEEYFLSTVRYSTTSSLRYSATPLLPCSLALLLR